MSPFSIAAVLVLVSGVGPFPARPSSDGSQEAAVPRAGDLQALRGGFARPPQGVGPWVYWFWWDNVLSRDEIARELEELAVVGFAGAEIRVVTFRGWGGKTLAGMDAAGLQKIGHRRLAYLSDEWLDVMEFTCARAEQLGLRLAVNMGQGWPPGGPWINEQHRSKHLTWTSRELEGPSVWSPADLPDGAMILAWRLGDPGCKSVVADSFRDLTPLVRRQGKSGALRWEVPDGRWLAGIFRVLPGGLCDKGEGPEVDPASREAVLFHLRHFFGRLDPRLRRYYGKTLVDVASDSWEYERPPKGGRYWSPAILEAFPRLAGYDLRGRMYALLGYGPDASRVLGDLEEVERRLVHENYFATVSRFLKERGLRHRPQVYGRGLARDLLEAFTLADTPEVEQGICLPEAPWAARTTGKPVVSAEAFTFLSRKLGPVRRPHGPWESNPADLRAASNHFFGEGVNRIQMHSFGYSPPGLALPGWRMYAEIHLNRNVPWWPFLRPLNDWLARQQWLLQSGRPVADVLVYPIRSNPEDGPFFSLGDRQPVSAANAVDGANERTLAMAAKAAVEGLYETRGICLLEELKTASEAEQILALLGREGRLWCVHSLPEEWPPLRGEGGGLLRRRFTELGVQGRVSDARAAGWRRVLDEARTVRWSPPEAALVFQHRRLGGGDLYFVVNYGGTFRGELSFPHAGRRAEIWDSDSGRFAPAGALSEREGRVSLPVSIDHMESVSIVFCEGERPVHVVEASGGDFHYDAQGRLCSLFSREGDYVVRLSDGSDRRLKVRLPPALEIAGPWRLSVDPARAVSPQGPLTLRLDRLVSWRELPELRRYAGTATYEADLEVPPGLAGTDVALFLELGEVYELARVEVNGRPAGTAWAPPFRLEITGLARPGPNTLRIEVPNQLKNHLEAGDDYRRPSGLLGPVRLVPAIRKVLSESRNP